MMKHLLTLALVGFGGTALVWGIWMLFSGLRADELHRVALENAHGGGNGPEIFAGKMIGISCLVLLAGALNWCIDRRKKTKGQPALAE